MPLVQPLVYKVATEPHEFELIHALNHRTFVEEIPQHRSNVTRRLVDRFHAQNTYVVCMAGAELVGMVAVRGQRPFSLDEKLADLDAYLPRGRNVCEIRLLAVEPKYRKTTVFAGLVLRLVQLARARGYDLALISGTVRQLKLYRHLGFEPFGPRVGTPGAEYQPMMLTLEGFESAVAPLLAAHENAPHVPFSFLPGPVSIAAEVREKLAEAPLSHRSEPFRRLMGEVRGKLLALTGARHVSLLLGSGTLANDVVAGQLSLRSQKGLIISNGEFGERLIDHGRRWRLDFDVYRLPWGQPFDLVALRRRLQGMAWAWFVHCETSTGMLNDLESLRDLCRPLGIDLCVDAISSLGTVPCELRDIAFATGVSGKGLASYPGIAMVFHRDPPKPGSERLPRYLDLSLYAGEPGTPFTHSSNLLAALSRALDGMSARYARLREDAAYLREQAESSGLAAASPAGLASPAVLTLALPRSAPGAKVAERLAGSGYAIAYASRYLLERNWIQVALMGDYARHRLPEMMAALRQALHTRDEKDVPRRALPNG